MAGMLRPIGSGAEDSIAVVFLSFLSPRVQTRHPHLIQIVTLPATTHVLKAGFSRRLRGRIACTLLPSGPRRFALRGLKRHAQTHHPRPQAAR